MEFSRCMVTLLLLLCLVHHLPAVFEADLSVSPGETVTLPCNGGTDKDISEVKVFWIFGSMTVCLFQNGTWCEHPHFVSRTQLRSIQQKNFSLVINPVRLEDQGEYMCLINGAEIQINHLNVKGVSVGGRKQTVAEIPPADSLVCKPYEDKDKEVPDENPPGALSSVWLIVNLSVIVVILVIAGIVSFIKRRRKQPGTQMRTEPTPNTESDPLNVIVPNSPQINSDNLETAALSTALKPS